MVGDFTNIDPTIKPFYVKSGLPLYSNSEIAEKNNANSIPSFVLIVLVMVF
jgi:hypothetical protein